MPAWALGLFDLTTGPSAVRALGIFAILPIFILLCFIFKAIVFVCFAAMPPLPITTILKVFPEISNLF